jgi:hypothetical protein
VLEVLDDRERQIHDYLLLCRNKLVAHTDAAFADLEPIVAIDLPQTLVVPLRNDTLAPFTPEYSARVGAISEKLWTWTVEERHRTEPGIKPMLRESRYLEILGCNADAV